MQPCAVTLNGLAAYLIEHLALQPSVSFASPVIFFATVAHQGVRLGRKTYLVDMEGTTNRLCIGEQYGDRSYIIGTCEAAY